MPFANTDKLLLIGLWMQVYLNGTEYYFHFCFSFQMFANIIVRNRGMPTAVSQQTVTWIYYH